jgi:hypothetical protein
MESFFSAIENHSRTAATIAIFLIVIVAIISDGLKKEKKP